MRTDLSDPPSPPSSPSLDDHPPHDLPFKHTKVASSSSSSTTAKFTRTKGEPQFESDRWSRSPPTVDNHSHSHYYHQPGRPPVRPPARPPLKRQQPFNNLSFTPFIPQSVSHQTQQSQQSQQSQQFHDRRTQEGRQQGREFGPRHRHFSQHAQAPFPRSQFPAIRDYPPPSDFNKVYSSSTSSYISSSEQTPKPSLQAIDITQICPPPMGRKDKRKKFEPRVTQTVSVQESDSHHAPTPSSSVHNGVKSHTSHPGSETAPASGLQGINSEPSSIRPSPPSSARVLPEDKSSARTENPLQPAPSGANQPNGDGNSDAQSDGGWGAPPVEADVKPKDEGPGELSTAPDKSAVPTWTGPAVHANAQYFDRPGRPKWTRTTNNIAVPHPRRWGGGADEVVDTPEAEPSPTPAPPSKKPAEDDNAWDPTSRLHQWVSHVQQHGSPPSPSPSLPIHIPKTISEASSDLVRPSSAREIKPPVTIFYSDSEAASPQSSKKAVEDVQPSVRGTEDISEIGDTEQPEDSEDGSGAPADHASVSRIRTSARSHPRDRSLSRQYTGSTQLTHAGGGGRPRRPGPYDNMSQKEKWWKKESHPAGCPTFASRRIRVVTTFPVRTEELKRSLHDHFSRYGPVRCVVPTESGKESTDRMTVVFKDGEAVKKVLADEKGSKSCVYRSTYSRSGSTTLTLGISHYPRPTLSYVWVKVSGPRFDSRSRSASPVRVRDDGGWGTEEIHDYRPLPESVGIFAVPKFINKANVWVHRAEVVQPHDQIYWRGGKGYAKGSEPIFLTEIHMGRRVLEKDFLPQLVDYFVDIHEVVPPGDISTGWVFGVASTGEARYLMNCLAVIPGIFTRFARDSDRFEIKPFFSPIKESLLSLVEDDDDSHSEDDSPPSSELGEAEPALKKTILVPPASLPSKPVDQPLEEYPHLERQVVLTYRGRLIREELVEGQPRYIDDAAIFVGRLVKEQENTMSLLKRFEVYGKIVCVEYNPMTSNSTYGTARVLFQDAAAAKKAIEWENGAVSFGSAIKVEPRKVLPMDVQARAMYVDPDGRAVSPSIAHQYQYIPPPTATENMVPQYEAPPPPAPPPPPPQTADPYPPSWYSVMGPPGHWMSQMFMPPPPGAPMPVASPPPVDHGTPPRPPPPSMMPMMWQIGVGFYPGSYPPPMPFHAEQPKGPFPSYAGPPPAHPDFHAAMGSLSIGQPINAHPTASVPVPQAATASQEVTPSATGAQATSSQDATPMAPGPQPSVIGLTDTSSAKELDDDGLSQDNKTTLRAVGSKYEDGVFKVLYDPQELKQYREEHQLKESPPPTPTPSLPPLHSPIESPLLPLLPLHTGGHEPHRRPASQASSYMDMNPAFRGQPLNRFPQDFDASGRRSSFVSPMGNRFPDPIGPRMDNAPRQVVPPPYGPPGDQHSRMGYGEPRGRMGGGGNGEGEGGGRRFGAPKGPNRMGGGRRHNGNYQGWDQQPEAGWTSPQPVYPSLGNANEPSDIQSPPGEFTGGW